MSRAVVKDDSFLKIVRHRVPKTGTRWGSSGFDHTDPFFISAEVLKFDDSVDLRKQRIVRTPAHVYAGMNPRTSLPDNNRSGAYHLAGKPFHSQALAVAVATVLGTSYTFFMSHF
jgi:hypothetical protein